MIRAVLGADPAAYRFAFDGRGSFQFAEMGESPVILRYRIDDLAIAKTLGVALTPNLADLVELAIAIYVADRLARRRPRHADRYHPHLTRRISARLPVRQPERWCEQSIQDQLSELLWLLTDDIWEFEFIQRKGQPRQSEVFRSLIPASLSSPVTVGLFSGGLDSLAGACRYLASTKTGTLVLVSGQTSKRVSAIQGDLIQELRRRSSRDIRSMAVGFGLVHRHGDTDRDEPTQRSRGFIFPVLGSVAACLAGATELQIHEPGIGAINLPFSDAQLGAQSTRANDPRALDAIARFISRIAETDFRIRTPYLLSTKAELVAFLSTGSLADLIKKSISCDAGPLRDEEYTHCGRCTSCLLRRHALFAGGLGGVDRSAGIYKYDIWAGGLLFKKLDGLRVMDYQAQQLAWAVHQDQPWRELCRMYPQLVEIASAVAGSGQTIESVQSQLVGLYGRYCAEWERFRGSLSLLGAA